MEPIRSTASVSHGTMHYSECAYCSTYLLIRSDQLTVCMPVDSCELNDCSDLGGWENPGGSSGPIILISFCLVKAIDSRPAAEWATGLGLFRSTYASN